MGVVSSLRGRLKFLNRRNAPRIPVELPADFAQTDESVFLFHRALNISRTGAFIHTEAPLPVGSTIEVDFTLLGDDAFAAPARQVVCAAEVVNATAPGARPGRLPGMGVRFVNLSEEEWDLLHAHVTALKVAGAQAPRVTVALAQPDPDQEKRQIEELERLTPELRQEVADFSWAAPGRRGTREAEPDTIPEEELIAEIEQRMQSDGPDLRFVRDGDPPPKPPEANFELRSNGIVEAKRTRDDLGLVAKDTDAAETAPLDPVAETAIETIAQIVEEPDPAPPPRKAVAVRRRKRRLGKR